MFLVIASWVRCQSRAISAARSKVPISEYHDVVLLMVTFLVYAWCAGDDLQIVPENGAVIMETSHHGDVLVHFPDEERMKSFVREMSECGFPAHHEKEAGLVCARDPGRLTGG